MTLSSLADLDRPAAMDPALRDGYEVHRAALRRGFDVTLLPRQVMMVRSPESKVELSFVHGVPSTSTLSGVTFAQDKRMRRAQIEAAGLPIPKGGNYSVSKGVADAKRLVKKIGFPVVIKPSRGDNMVEVHPGIQNNEQLDEAVDYLRTYPDDRPTYVKAAYALTLLGEPEEVDGRVTAPRGYRFLVEKHVPGDYLRFLVIGDSVRSVIHCVDGAADLNSSKNRDVLSETHPSFVDAALTAARAITGLSVVAVDLVVTDFRSSAASQEYWVVELSERPWLEAQATISDTLTLGLADDILRDHAASSGIELAVPVEDIDISVRLEGLVDPTSAVVDIQAEFEACGLDCRIDVIDAVEGVAAGAVGGTPDKIAYIGERLLNGQLNGHRAMLIDECHRAAPG